MGIERQHSRLEIVLCRKRDRPPDESLMPDMHTIKISNSESARPETPTGLVE
jgi:hypothetical protein